MQCGRTCLNERNQALPRGWNNFIIWLKRRVLISQRGGPFLTHGDNNGNDVKLPWERSDLAPESAVTPSWHDPSRVIEQVTTEAAVLAEARELAKVSPSANLEVP